MSKHWQAWCYALLGVSLICLAVSIALILTGQ